MDLLDCNMTISRYLTVNDAAKTFNVPISTMRKMAKVSKAEIKFGYRTVLIDAQVLRDYLDSLRG